MKGESAMKKFAALFVVIAILCCVGIASAKDIVINQEIKAIAFKNDKNGNQYVRIFVEQDRTLNGISYKRDIALMGFGDVVAPLKAYKKGQKVKLVVSEGEFRGNPSYRILAVSK
jgi:hypothetical protein